MILSDRDVKLWIRSGKLKIEPLDLEKQIMPVGIDLRLGNEFRIFRMDHRSHIDPMKISEDYTKMIRVEEGNTFMLHHGEFVLGVTKEYIKLPNDLAARIDGRSSLGRMGIILHSTGGHIDPGFEGKLTLEISNIGKMPVKLYPGMKFCSLIFEKLSTPVEQSYKGKYSGATEPVVSKISEELKKII